MRNFIRNTIQSQKVFYRYFRKKGLRRFFKENILQSEGSAKNKAQSIALGVFIGFSPFWGLHTVLALSLSTLFKRNKTLAFISSQITIPPAIPLILYLSMLIGGPFVGSTKNFDLFELSIELAKQHLLQYVVGSLILATLMSLILGLLSYFLILKFNPKTNPKAAFKKPSP
ncbi:DUF2062 domain-containing protein [Chryseobacterium sp. A301]